MTNGMKMAESGMRMNGTAFFYYAAQTYMGATRIFAQCHSLKQFHKAFVRGEVVLMKDKIVARGGWSTYKKCLKLAQSDKGYTPRR